MIAVIANPSDHDVIREFFELFKTPWEFYEDGRNYPVVLCACDQQVDTAASLVLIYSSAHGSDETSVVTSAPVDLGRKVSYRSNRLPLYGHTAQFRVPARSLLQDETGSCLAYVRTANGQAVVRIGYDLFSEVRTLLTTGQPAANAMSPALEMHIAFLRDRMIEAGIEFIEIPPVPEGHPFIVCLTHDVDHPLMRPDGWDHTYLGFMFRAVIGSALSLLRGRISIRNLFDNLSAAVKSVFVQLGLAQDLWSSFAARYLALEGGLPSTYFVIPFRGHAGKTSEGNAPKFRAANYGARDIAAIMKQLKDSGCEVSVHGLDAWMDASAAVRELAEIKSITNTDSVGVRMHWLYFDQSSPVVLERAGAEYDSTVGFNGTVGFRAGTAQAYKPLNAMTLLEVPLIAMDTALFYPAHMSLSQKKAEALLDRLIEQATSTGGCLTINWHDRSILPERHWGGAYVHFLEMVQQKRAWIATVSHAATWFRQRRAATFAHDENGCVVVTATQPEPVKKRVPGLRVRVWENRASGTYSESVLRDAITIQFKSYEHSISH